MITIEMLLKTASDADTLSQAITDSTESYHARSERDRRFTAAEAMEKLGLKAVNGIFGIDAFRPAPGEILVLKKGAVVLSTHPRVPRDGKVSGQRRKVKVHSIMPGHIDLSDWNNEYNRNTCVQWVGTGSYWFWADLNDFEKIQEG